MDNDLGIRLEIKFIIYGSFIMGVFINLFFN